MQTLTVLFFCCNVDIYISFSSLIAVARTSKTVKVVRVSLLVLSDLRGNAFSFSPSSVMLAVCFMYNGIVSAVQSLSHIRIFATPWIATRQAYLSITNSWSLLKFMSITLVMPSNHLILCHPLLLPPSIFPSIRVFSNESVLCIKWPKYWSFSFSRISWIAPWKKSSDQPRQHIKKQRHCFTNKGLSSQSYGFSSSHVWI